MFSYSVIKQSALTATTVSLLAETSNIISPFINIWHSNLSLLYLKTEMCSLEMTSAKCASTELVFTLVIYTEHANTISHWQRLVHLPMPCFQFNVSNQESLNMISNALHYLKSQSCVKWEVLRVPLPFVEEQRYLMFLSCQNNRNLLNCALSRRTHDPYIP